MDHSSTVEMNHIAVIIPEAHATIHQSSSLEGVPDTQSEEPASVNLNTNANRPATEESDAMAQAAASDIAAVSKSPVGMRLIFTEMRRQRLKDVPRLRVLTLIF